MTIPRLIRSPIKSLTRRISIALRHSLGNLNRAQRLQKRWINNKGPLDIRARSRARKEVREREIRDNVLEDEMAIFLCGRNADFCL